MLFLTISASRFDLAAAAIVERKKFIPQACGQRSLIHAVPQVSYGLLQKFFHRYPADLEFYIVV